MTLHAVASGWLLGPASGANRRLLALLEHVGPMLAAGERVTVLHRPDHVPPPLPRIAFVPIPIPAAPAWARARAERRLLPSALRELGATVYEHGFLPLPRLDVPTCFLVHDLRAADGLTRWPSWLARALLRGACARARAVVVPSQWTASRIREIVPRIAPPHVVPNGVTVPAPAGPPLPWELPAHGYLLHVGHVEPRKNLGVVVDALATLPLARRPELWLAGRDAGAGSALEARARAHDVVVRALGAVDEPTLGALYRSARTVVMPSRHEGFGLPVLEALGHGRPVLVSAAGALPEVAGPCSDPLPVDDPAAWARAIDAPPHLDLAGCRLHVARFSWLDAARRTLALWRAVAR